LRLSLTGIVVAQNTPVAFEVATIKPSPPPGVLSSSLGLKLESSKGPVEVLVIDSVERPTEN
jgi:hypothetical protein